MYQGGRQSGAWGNPDRFWKRLDQSGGPEACWPIAVPVGVGGYGARLSPKGYGRANFKGRTTTAQRVAYLMVNGDIPPDMVVRHTCDNPPCCNPAHLILGTKAENTADMMRRNRNHWLKRTHCKNGHDFDVHGQIATRADGKQYRRCMACRRNT